jgi:hypothetical protein
MEMMIGIMGMIIGIMGIILGMIMGMIEIIGIMWA